MPRGDEHNAQLRAESREQILKAARHLFAEAGYFKTRVSDIARRAGMSQGNLYWYYPTKQDVLKAVLADGFERQNALLAEVASLPNTGREKLLAALDRYVELYGELGRFTTILLSLMSHGGPAFIAELGFDMAEIGSGYHQLLGGIIAEAQADGDLLALDPDLLVTFVYSFFNGLLITYGDLWPQLPPGVLRDAVLRLLGICDR